jgi:hypothetical protein
MPLPSGWENAPSYSVRRWLSALVGFMAFIAISFALVTCAIEAAHQSQTEQAQQADHPRR